MQAKSLKGTLCQYKTCHYGKLVLTDCDRFYTPNVDDMFVTYSHHPLVGGNNTQPPKSIKHPTGTVPAILVDQSQYICRVGLTELEYIERTKYVLLPIATKCLGVSLKNKPNVVLMKKVYYQIQMFNPITSEPYKDNFWVEEDWIEPLTENSYSVDYLEQFKKRYLKRS